MVVCHMAGSSSSTPMMWLYTKVFALLLLTSYDFILKMGAKRPLLPKNRVGNFFVSLEDLNCVDNPRMRFGKQNCSHWIVLELYGPDHFWFLDNCHQFHSYNMVVPSNEFVDMLGWQSSARTNTYDRNKWGQNTGLWNKGVKATCSLRHRVISKRCLSMMKTSPFVHTIESMDISVYLQGIARIIWVLQTNFTKEIRPKQLKVPYISIAQSRLYKSWILLQ